MKLKHSFSQETRNLFAFTWVCWECGKNGQDSGGLEIHHIMGRVSASAMNASVLCKECHSRMNHSIEEEQKLISINAQYLFVNEYEPNHEDVEFIEKNIKRINTYNKKWPIHEVMKLIYKILSVNTCRRRGTSSTEITQSEFMIKLKELIDPCRNFRKRGYRT